MILFFERSDQFSNHLIWQFKLQTFTSKLEISVDLPPNLEPRSLAFSLKGQSHIPQISIIEPVSENDSSRLLDFGMVLNHEPCDKVLMLQNVGKVMAEVILNIDDNLKGFYSVYLVSDSPCGCKSDKIGNSQFNYLRG